MLFSGEDTTSSIIDDENLFDNNDGGSQGSVNSSNSSQSSNSEISLVGEWHCDRSITPQAFYGEFYDEDITKTNVVLRTAYIFGADGTFTEKTEIVNISQVRKEYRSLMVAGGRKKLALEGKYLTTDDVLYYENYADEALERIFTTQSGKYKKEENKIVYSVNGENYYESFTLENDKLIITFSSASDTGYPLTFVKE